MKYIFWNVTTKNHGVKQWDLNIVLTLSLCHSYIPLNTSQTKKHLYIFSVNTCTVPIVDHASASPETSISFNTDVTYTCNTGYTISGDATRSCNADGSLTGTEPVCTSK